MTISGGKGYVMVRHHCIRVAIGISLMLLAMICVQWIRGNWWAETVEVFWNVRPHSRAPAWPAASAIRIQHYRGYLRVWYVREMCLPSPDGRPLRWRYICEEGNIENPGRVSMAPNPPPRGALGFHFVHNGYFFLVWLPDLAIAIATATIPCGGFLLLRRRSRQQGAEP